MKDAYLFTAKIDYHQTHCPNIPSTLNKATTNPSEWGGVAIRSQNLLKINSMNQESSPTSEWVVVRSHLLALLISEYIAVPFKTMRIPREAVVIQVCPRENVKDS